MSDPLAAALERGILAFPATPFADDGSLDVPALERHVAAIAGNRPVALVPAGGAGELFSIDAGEHAQVVRATVAAAAGLPVVAGIGGGLAMARQEARAAEAAGADGVLLLPPYLVKSEQEGLAAYVRAVAAATDLPLIVYSRDNGVFRPDTLLRLAESCPTLIGVKDGTGDLDLVLETRRRTQGRLLLINGAPTAEMLAAQTFAIGVAAYSSAVFAFAPDIAGAFYAAVVAGDRGRQEALLDGFYFPYSAIRRRRAGNAVSIVKAGLKVTGQPVGAVRPPLLELGDADCDALAALIRAGSAIARQEAARLMLRIALVGNTQGQAERLRSLLPFEAEILLDDDTRANRNAPLEVDAAVSIRFNPADIAAIRCRLLQCSGVGVDGIALEQLPRQTVVCNVHEHEIPIAEYVLAGILEHEIGLSRAVATFEGAEWGKLFRGRTLHGETAGKTLAVVGFGRIGKAVALRARAFGMRIVGVNRSGRPAPEADSMVRFDRLGEVLPQADYVVLACPLTEATRGLIGPAEFAAMKPSALLINVARGEVVDEAALWDAMTAQRIAAALIDTWYTYPTLAQPDPMPARFPFETLASVRCTPHISGWTAGLMARRYRAMAENLARFARGEPLLNVIWRDGRPAEAA